VLILIRVLTLEDGDGLDLDELTGVAERRHAEEHASPRPPRARRPAV
jgi:hypothetical protein